MKSGFRYVLLGSVALAAAGAAPAAIERNSSVVRVTAVVTNARGEPVPGLRATDFQVTVDGAPHAVDTLEFRNDGSETPRVFAFLLDEFHVEADASATVRDVLLPLVDRLRPHDLALVFKPLDLLTSIEPTADRNAIRDSIASFAGRKGDYTPRTVFEQRYMAQAPNAVITARAQIVSSALRAMASRLGELSGMRPAIVLVSDGFGRQRADRGSPANLLSAVRVANRGDIPIYVFAPGEMAVAPGTDGVDAGRTALQAIATQTGGDFHAGVGTFAGGFNRMARELDTHYVLTYASPHGDDGQFHSVVVTLNRPDARVRARAGYVAPLSAELRAAAMPAIVPTRVLRRSTLIQSWSGITKGADGRPRVTFTWEPAPARPGSAAPAATTLVLTASTPNGTVLFDGNVSAVGASGSSNGRSLAQFDAAPGRVLIDIKILDAKGVVLDSDARDVDVPKLENPRGTILSPALLRVASAREFREVRNDPNAAPVPSRDFRRTERLLLRVPAYDASGTPMPVDATLLNRWRQPMRALPAMSDSPQEGITQFEVPLASLAPGEYTIRLIAGALSEHVTFRVRG